MRAVQRPTSPTVQRNNTSMAQKREPMNRAPENSRQHRIGHNESGKHLWQHQRQGSTTRLAGSRVGGTDTPSRNERQSRDSSSTVTLHRQQRHPNPNGCQPSASSGASHTHARAQQRPAQAQPIGSSQRREQPQPRGGTDPQTKGTTSGPHKEQRDSEPSASSEPNTQRATRASSGQSRGSVRKQQQQGQDLQPGQIAASRLVACGSSRCSQSQTGQAGQTFRAKTKTKQPEARHCASQR